MAALFRFFCVFFMSFRHSERWWNRLIVLPYIYKVLLASLTSLYSIYGLVDLDKQLYSEFILIHLARVRYLHLSLCKNNNYSSQHVWKINQLMFCAFFALPYVMILDSQYGTWSMNLSLQLFYVASYLLINTKYRYMLQAITTMSTTSEQCLFIDFNMLPEFWKKR